MKPTVAITCLALVTALAGCRDDATEPLSQNMRGADSAAMHKGGSSGSRFSGYMVGAGDETATSQSRSLGDLPAQPSKYKAVPSPHGNGRITASADIGPDGGMLRLPATGLTVIVPRGAVSTRTHFSVTSQGDMMGYTFEPHGARFAVPLRVTQSLGLTDMLANLLTPFQVAYFADDAAVDAATQTVAARELLALTIDRAVSGVTFEVWHFSGYMLVSARAE